MRSENAEVEDGEETEIELEIDVSTSRTTPIYQYICPGCGNSFNYPARFTTSIPPYVVDGCPFCGYLFWEGLSGEDSTTE